MKGFQEGYEEVWVRVPTNAYDLGYLAGLIDGEGCISFNPIGQKGQWGRYTLSIYNTDLRVMEWLAQIGGSYHGRVRGEGNPLSKKMQYEWRVRRAADVKAILETVLPILIIKYDVAKRVVKFLNGRLKVVNG